MTEELSGQAALAAKLSAVIHEFCEDLPWKDSERIGADAARAAWDCGSTNAAQTQWAVRLHDGTVLPMFHEPGEERARRVAANAARPVSVLRRQVGPWMEAA